LSIQNTNVFVSEKNNLKETLPPHRLAFHFYTGNRRKIQIT